MLKNKVVTTLILLHFDMDRKPVVLWAISAALLQEHDGVYKSVTFTSRTLKPDEINYGMDDMELLALLRIRDICYSQLVTRSISVLTRHSKLAWLLHSSGLQGRLERLTALLSSWTLEIVKCTNGEDEILGVIAASISPRKGVDFVSIAARKQLRQQLDHAVNKAKYHGLLLHIDLLSDMDRERLILCGDSNFVIRIGIKAALHREDEVVIAIEEDRQDLMTLYRLDELLITKHDVATVNIIAVTRLRKKCRSQVVAKSVKL
ncbi:Reverse transcriptase [Phytophthora palmivora]|uniref:Reverse transcriptase n=1 Tax=Phytophthora palmivora TaxID=4796 RepID=A0A2P4YDA5_9STRA|nr:Reverse transcriptase [Phytophthora palmivora]